MKKETHVNKCKYAESYKNVLLLNGWMDKLFIPNELLDSIRLFDK